MRCCFVLPHLSGIERRKAPFEESPLLSSLLPYFTCSYSVSSAPVKMQLRLGV